MADELLTRLVELEQRLQDPSTRKDAATLTELLSAEFREFGASGRVWDRAGIIAELGGEGPRLVRSEGFRVQGLSDALALLTYVAVTQDRKTLRSSLWRLERGHWRLLFHQGTVVLPASQAEISR